MDGLGKERRRREQGIKQRGGGGVDVLTDLFPSSSDLLRLGSGENLCWDWGRRRRTRVTLTLV